MIIGVTKQRLVFLVCLCIRAYRTGFSRVVRSDLITYR